MSSASVTLGNNFLNMYQGIMLPSLPVSILYDIAMLLSPVYISNLAVSINQFLFMHTELVLNSSISSSLYSWSTSCSISLTTLLLLLRQTFLKCPILPHSIHILPYAGHSLSWWILLTVSTQLSLCGPLCWSSCFVIFCFIGYFDFIKLL